MEGPLQSRMKLLNSKFFALRRIMFAFLKRNFTLCTDRLHETRTRVINVFANFRLRFAHLICLTELIEFKKLRALCAAFSLCPPLSILSISILPFSLLPVSASCVTETAAGLQTRSCHFQTFQVGNFGFSGQCLDPAWCAKSQLDQQVSPSRNFGPRSLQRGEGGARATRQARQFTSGMSPQYSSVPADPGYSGRHLCELSFRFNIPHKFDSKLSSFEVTFFFHFLFAK
jgi:hypothetical protein